MAPQLPLQLPLSFPIPPFFSPVAFILPHSLDHGTSCDTWGQGLAVGLAMLDSELHLMLLEVFLTL